MSRKIVNAAFVQSQSRALCPFAMRNILARQLPHSKPVRHASTAPPSKTIVLEQPDKFRPPSHPQRLNRRPPRQYPGPPLSETERQAQKTKRYPHMFPNEGTFMHWFLTNRTLHFLITMGTLCLLSVITLTQHFIHTSPFAHIVPPISSLPFHPYSFFTDWVAALRMHQDWNTERVAQKRRDTVLDAQKQRLYRRAHGIEDLNAEEEHGVDVRGLVPWDDGLTNKERAAGGRDPDLSTKMIHAMKYRDEDGNLVDVKDALAKEYTKDEEGRIVHIPQPEVGEDGQVKKRKIKRWFGIWE